MYKHILIAVDLSDEGTWRKPLIAGAEHARKFGAQLTILTVIREIEAVIEAKAGPLAYEVITASLENELAERVREVGASDLHPQLVVSHGTSIYAEILGIAEDDGADLIVVGSHRPAMKDYLLGTNAGRVVRHANCSVLVCRD